MRECWVIEEQNDNGAWYVIFCGGKITAEEELARWPSTPENPKRLVRYVPEPGEEWVDALKWKLAALLKDRTRRDIRARVRSGETAQSVAEDFGVPVQFVEVVATRQMFEDAPPQEDRP